MSKKGMAQQERNRIIRILNTKYGFRCWYCGRELDNMDDGIQVHIDHIIPSSKNKDDSIENLALSCEFCNRAKFKHSAEEFLKYLSYVRSERFWCPILKDIDIGFEL